MHSSPVIRQEALATTISSNNKLSIKRLAFIPWKSFQRHAKQFGNIVSSFSFQSKDVKLSTQSVGMMPMCPNSRSTAKPGMRIIRSEEKTKDRRRKHFQRCNCPRLAHLVILSLRLISLYFFGDWQFVAYNRPLQRSTPLWFWNRRQGEPFDLCRPGPCR